MANEKTNLGEIEMAQLALTHQTAIAAFQGHSAVKVGPKAKPWKKLPELARFMSLMVEYQKDAFANADLFQSASDYLTQIDHAYQSLKNDVDKKPKVAKREKVALKIFGDFINTTIKEQPNLAPEESLRVHTGSQYEPEDNTPFFIIDSQFTAFNTLFDELQPDQQHEFDRTRPNYKKTHHFSVEKTDGLHVTVKKDDAAFFEVEHIRDNLYAFKGDSAYTNNGRYADASPEDKIRFLKEDITAVNPVALLRVANADQSVQAKHSPPIPR